MLLQSPDMDKAYEGDVDFSQQREYLAQFQPIHSFFVDWLLAIYWELQGKVSPFEYATRVCVAKNILENTNTDHVMSSQKVLLRVVRNLFPYAKLTSEVPKRLVSILGESRGHIKPPKFRPLQDNIIKNEALVALRYDVLGKAFCAQAVNLIKMLQENVDEEELNSSINIAADSLKAAKDDMSELKRLRGEFFFSYPEEELTSVADSTLKKELELKRRSELPKDMEPEYMQKMISKYEVLLRGRLQSIIMSATDISKQILERKRIYMDDLNQLLAMCAMVQSYVNGVSFDQIKNRAHELAAYIDKKFDLANYLPKEVLADIAAGNQMYKNGFL